MLRLVEFFQKFSISGKICFLWENETRLDVDLSPVTLDWIQTCCKWLETWFRPEYQWLETWFGLVFKLVSDLSQMTWDWTLNSLKWLETWDLTWNSVKWCETWLVSNVMRLEFDSPKMTYDRPWNSLKWETWLRLVFSELKLYSNSS